MKNIMTQNVDRILARGERLDDLMGKSEDLQAGVSVTVRFLLLYIFALLLVYRKHRVALCRFIVEPWSQWQSL